jgi:hypothetical protein
MVFSPLVNYTKGYRMQIIGILEKNIKYALGIHECRIR